MAQVGVTFIPTTSLDGTTDLVVSRLGSERVFRFNFDLWRDYAFRFDAGGFAIVNPAGRKVGEDDIAKVYWRKPQRTRHLFPDRPRAREDAYVEDELWYAFREAIALLRARGRLVLVDPDAEIRAGKLSQWRLAADLFPVPAWRFLRGGPGDLRTGHESIAKSLTLGRIAEGAVLYATLVDEGELDPALPWLLNEPVAATHDVTAVFVRGDLFAFELDRRPFAARATDWRAVALEAESAWAPHTLPEDVARRARALMGRLGLDYGRLDFLLTPEGAYVFLEVNPNGEWGWLDRQGEFGVLERILREVDPETPVNPLPPAPSA